MPDPTTIKFTNVEWCLPGDPRHGEVVDLEIRNGQIARIEKPGTLTGDKLLTGGIVSPAWTDLRVYLTDPGQEWKEDVRTLSAAAMAGGFANITCHSATNPATGNAELVESLLHRTEHLATAFTLLGTVSEGRKGEELAELYDMHMAGVAGFSDGLKPLDHSGLVLRALKYVSSFNGLLMLLPMDSGLAGKKQIQEGKVSTHLGMQGIPSISEAIRLERDLKLIGYFNPEARVHFGPIRTAEGVEIIRNAKQRFPNITADTSVLYLIASDQALMDFDPNYKLWPPLGSESDREALIEGILDGTIDTLSSGHHPQALEDKVNDFSNTEYGAATIENAFGIALSALGGDHYATIVDRFTRGPARVLNMEPPRHLAEGISTRITWFDPTADTKIQVLKSKSRNNPFLGKTLPGVVLGVY